MNREKESLQKLLERSGHLLRLGLPIAARDSLDESVALIGENEALSWLGSQLEWVEAAIEKRDYIAAADRILFECLSQLEMTDSQA